MEVPYLAAEDGSVDEIQASQRSKSGRRSEVLVQEDAKVLEVCQFLTFDQRPDELVHMTHGLLIVLAADFLAVEGQELGSQPADSTEELLQPGAEQEVRVLENGSHIRSDQQHGGCHRRLGSADCGGDRQ